MEEGTKNMIYALTAVFLFILGMVNFVALFPAEQGFEFSKDEENVSFAKFHSNIQEGKDKTIGNLEELEKDLDKGFSVWDLTAGFLGSNQQKNSKNSVIGYFRSIAEMTEIVKDEVFINDQGTIHPVGIVFAILGAVMGVIGIIYVWGLIKQGQ